MPRKTRGRLSSSTPAAHTTEKALLAVNDATDPSRDTSLAATADANSKANDTEPMADTAEKENVPPALGVIHLETFHQETISRAVKTRKRSRPPRMVKLEEQEQEQSEDEDSDRFCADFDVEYESGRTADSITGQRKLGPKGVSARRGQEADLSEYERMRLENIKKNQEMLQLLGVPVVAAKTLLHSKDKENVDKAESADGNQERPVLTRVRIRREHVKAAPKVLLPARVSNRIRGLAAVPREIGEDDALASASVALGRKSGVGLADDANPEDIGDEEDAATLMSGDLFFDEETRRKAIRVDGHYKGWLNSTVMERYGFEKSAQDAWEANGGGTFSFKDPLGQSDVSDVSRSRSSKKPKHDAKMVAKAMFKKNPNAFFYRHNEPGQEQWTGDWTTEEGELFLKVAKEFGCGDKWGLFASHVPHRVGYQCSNYYRQVVLPEGLVFDPNYEYTSGGKPVYCGKYNQRRD